VRRAGIGRTKPLTGASEDESGPHAESAHLAFFHHWGESEAEQGSIYCTPCIVMFAMLEHGSWCDPHWRSDIAFLHRSEVILTVGVGM